MLKNNTQKIALALTYLNEKLTNQELYDYIIEKISEATTEKEMKLEFTKNSIKITEKKNNDKFQITFEPSIIDFSKITTEYECWNNSHKEQKKISFEQDRTKVKEIEATVYVTETEQINSIQKRVKEKEYLSNQLIYSHKFESETSIDISKNRCGSTEEIIYILPNKSAVKMICTTGEEDYFGQEGINYYKTEYCDEPNFNTREQNKGIYGYGMSNSTNEEFQEFITLWNNECKGIAKKK